MKLEVVSAVLWLSGCLLLLQDDAFEFECEDDDAEAERLSLFEMANRNFIKI